MALGWLPCGSSSEETLVVCTKERSQTLEEQLKRLYSEEVCDKVTIALEHSGNKLWPWSEKENKILPDHFDVPLP